MRRGCVGATMDCMGSRANPSSYAVLWRSGTGSVHAGRIDLDSRHVRLVGANRAGDRETIEVPRERIARVRVGRDDHERIERRASLVVELLQGEPVLLTDALGVGAVGELADRLSPSP